MRIRDAFICAALAAAPLQAQQAVTEADARAVVAAVLAHQVSIRGAEGAAETCVIDALDRPPAAPGVATEEDPLAPDHAVHIYFQWHVPDAPPPGRASAAPTQPAAAGGRRGRPRVLPPPPPAPLDAAQAAQLNALRLQAARAPAAAPALARIDESLVPAPLHLIRPNDDCAQLTLSRPAFAGDAAFVELAYACGTVCGNGALYALQRREGRWVLVGVADIWIR